MKLLEELVDSIATGIARQQGYYLSQIEAQCAGKRWPSLSQLFRNPGLIACVVDTEGRVGSWRGVRGRKKVDYPYSMIRVNCEAKYYVDFGKDLVVNGISESLPEDEGWRCLKVIIQRSIMRGDSIRKLVVDHTRRNGTPLGGYAEMVAARVGVKPDTILKGVIGP